MTIYQNCNQYQLLGTHCRSDVRLFVRIHSPVERPVIRQDAGGDGHYGSRRGGGKRSHKGMDLATEVGQNVFSPLSGFVTKVGWANKTHKYVEIAGTTEMKDLDGNVHAGENCVVRVMYVKPTVRKGQYVRAGELIGTADDLHRDKQSPAIVGQHVHVEVRIGDANIDPEHIVPVGR